MKSFNIFVIEGCLSFKHQGLFCLSIKDLVEKKQMFVRNIKYMFSMVKKVFLKIQYFVDILFVVVIVRK